jgi:hypothetical protein
MTKEQEIQVAHAINLLQESGAVFICIYGFPGETESFVEGIGDRDPDHQRTFLQALYQHWHGDEPRTDL